MSEGSTENKNPRESESSDDDNDDSAETKWPEPRLNRFDSADWSMSQSKKAENTEREAYRPGANNESPGSEPKSAASLLARRALSGGSKK